MKIKMIRTMMIVLLAAMVTAGTISAMPANAIVTPNHFDLNLQTGPGGYSVQSNGVPLILVQMPKAGGHHLP